MDSYTVSLPAIAYGFFQFTFTHYQTYISKTLCPCSKPFYYFLLSILPIFQLIGNWVDGGAKVELLEMMF